MKLLRNLKYIIKLLARLAGKILNLRWIRKINPVHHIRNALKKRDKNKIQRRAAELAKAIRNDLTRQGYTYVVVRKNKRNRRQRVRFRKPIVVTAEMCYLMIDVAELPYRVKTADLVTDDCLRSLSDRVQSTVRVEYIHGNLAYTVRLSGKNFPVTFSFNGYKLHPQAPALALPMGIGEKKEHAYLDLVRSIHLLVVGPTGKGKSTFIHSSMVTLLDRNEPEDLQFWLADLKKSEFSVYEPLRSGKKRKGTVARIVYEEEDAVNMLQDAFDEMKRRQKKFQEVDAVDLEDYARLTNSYMPRIVVIIDEILQLMTSKNKIGGVTVKQWTEQHLVNLAAQGRGAGVHVIIATQVVNSEVLTTRILANFENVVCFGVKDWRQSQLAIQDSRAEGLPRGRIILKFENEYWEYQTCLLSPQNKRLAVSRIQQAGPGNGLSDANEAKRFLNDAMLCVKVSIEQFDGQWSNKKIYNAVREHVPSTRVEEVARILVRDGVLIAGSSKRKGRWVAKPFEADINLLKNMYAQPDQHDDQQGKPAREQAKSKPEEIEETVQVIDMSDNDGVYEYQKEKKINM